jgi:hypothetical protein
MCCDQDRGSADLDQVEKVSPGHWIQTNCRLIKVCQLWARQQGQSRTQLPPVAATQDARILVGLVKLEHLAETVEPPLKVLLSSHHRDDSAMLFYAEIRPQNVLLSCDINVLQMVNCFNVLIKYLDVALGPLDLHSNHIEGA